MSDSRICCGGKPIDKKRAHDGHNWVWECDECGASMSTLVHVMPQKGEHPDIIAKTPVASVVDIEQVTKVSITDLPDGEYRAVWGGYLAEVVIDGKLYRMTTSVGVRTMQSQCVVRVDNGVVSILALETHHPGAEEERTF